MSKPARSIVFTPPPERNDAPPPRVYEEPDEGVLLLGEMLRDVRVQQDMLRELPFAGQDEYRGNLRVIASAADRVRQKCVKLLGESEQGRGA